MGIVNRRNAIVGWGVWKLAKEYGKQNKGALASMAAAIGGALWIWRKKSDETSGS